MGGLPFLLTFFPSLPPPFFFLFLNPPFLPFPVVFSRSTNKNKSPWETEAEGEFWGWENPQSREGTEANLNPKLAL